MTDGEIEQKVADIFASAADRGGLGLALLYHVT
jgi:hypothetical protein